MQQFIPFYTTVVWQHNLMAFISELNTEQTPFTDEGCDNALAKTEKWLVSGLLS